MLNILSLNDCQGLSKIIIYIHYNTKMLKCKFQNFKSSQIVSNFRGFQNFKVQKC